jgi:hypothetical protein
VTMAGQGKGAGPVRYTQNVVAPVGARGHSSPKGGATLPLMVYNTMARAKW